MESQNVRQMQQVAYVMSQTMAAQARIEGMKAENSQRAHTGDSMAYGDQDFEAVIIEFGIGHNAVTERLFT